MAELLAPAAYLGPVASAGLIPDSFASANKQIMTRMPHRAAERIVAVKLVFPNFYVSSTNSGTEAGSGADAAIESAVEAAGVKTRVQFGGANQGTIVNGSRIESDWCILPAPIEAGTVFWSRNWFSSAGGIVYASVAVQGSGANFGVNTANLVMVDGAINTGNTQGYGPVAVLGMTRRGTVVLCGDSRVAGTGDTRDTTLFRGALPRAIGSSRGIVNLGCPGDQARWAIGNYANRAALAAYCSHVAVAIGINDIVTGGRSAAQVHADIQTLLALTGLTGKPAWLGTIEPGGLSGTYTSEAGQTVAATQGVQATFNDAIRGGVDNVMGMFDIAKAVESTTTAGKIQAPNGNALTGDGLHLNRRGYLQAASAVNPAVFARAS